VEKMPRRSLIEQLDDAVEALLAEPQARPARVNPRLAPLLRVAGELRDLPREEFKARLKSELEGRKSMASVAEEKSTGVSPIPKGYHTITPYLVAENAPALIEFIKQTFGAVQNFQSIGSAGGIHAEVRLGDSMLMIGGGSPELSWQGESMPTSLHVYVEDADAVYQRALKAGATSVEEPTDQSYGDREAGVKDAAGNFWWIATRQQGGFIPEGLHSVTPFLHPEKAEPVIHFLKRAFEAEEVTRHASPDGVIQHAVVRIGDSALEMGEAHGPYQPMPSMFYLYVPNVDVLYRRALEAGATSISEPTDQAYGDRSAGVKDVFGNQWYIATHIKDVPK
jgi:PhnB protein